MATPAAAADTAINDVKSHHSGISSDSNVPEAPKATQDEEKEPAVKYGWRFWLIFPALCIV